jgi:E3 ubiquitin-protein ligase HUWE1
LNLDTDNSFHEVHPVLPGLLSLAQLDQPDLEEEEDDGEAEFDEEGDEDEEDYPGEEDEEEDHVHHHHHHHHHHGHHHHLSFQPMGDGDDDIIPGIRIRDLIPPEMDPSLLVDTSGGARRPIQIMRNGAIYATGFRTFGVNTRSRGQRGAAGDDGTNPLLQRAATNARNAQPDPRNLADTLPNHVQRLFRHGVINVSGDMLGQDRSLDAFSQHFQIQLDAAGEIERRTRRLIEGLMMTELGRRHPGGQLMPPPVVHERVRTDPVSVVHFDVGMTAGRWLEEVKMVFGQRMAEMAILLVPEIHRALIPAAIKKYREEERRAKAERELQEAQELKAREEQEAREKKEKEEREAKEQEERAAREAAEAAAAAAAAEEAARADAEANEGGAENEENEMQGVETSQTGESQPVAESSTAAGPTPRVTYRLRDREIDLTSLGIDPDFLDAIPPEMREEVLINQVMQHRATLGQGSSEAPRFDEEFLAALPPDMREEIIQAEAMELRRQQREEARRRQANPAQTDANREPEEMNPEDFLASLTSDLRQQILMEADEEMLSTFPDHIVAEARALGGGRARGADQPFRRRGVPVNNAHPGGAHAGAPETIRIHYKQVFEKQGISSLLRLLFMPQQGSVKALFKEILSAACQNRQNRAEIVSILLSILQDGSTDAGAIDRSFQHLSSKAKSSGTGKSPHIRRTESIAMSEMTPLRVVAQCLETLEYLILHNPKAMLHFMLTEHEPGTSSRKSIGKGKGKDSRASRFPVNAVLGLLNRKLIVENTPVLDVLSHLSQEITAHIVKMSEESNKYLADQKKEAEKKEAEKAEAESAAKAEKASQEQASGEAAQESGDAAPESKAEQAEKPKKPRAPPVAPEISEHNMRLVVSVIGSRELSSRSFKNILAMISSLSVMPKAKTIFGSELVRVAQDLGVSILRDLKMLLDEVRKADSASELQRVALARFSPASSDQTKLLRVITSLDYIFDPVRSALHTPFPSDEPKNAEEESETLRTLYENATFSPLWKTLSQCLSAIRDHKSTNMLNVATFLLPLIEVLMFVFKSSVRKLEKTPTADGGLASPTPESSMEAFFYRFTEDHKKILNELVRQNPKLMSGSFDLMVRNSKVLEFDNKRNYFHRQLHPRTNEQRPPHSSLQMTVRRDNIFHDSYRSLYYKKPEEIKYGKLNIKFQDEEGVDAGGVTREWFHELVKQMFNPGYVLFNPIASDRTTFHPNPLSGVNNEHLSFFNFVGRIIGKALYESRHLDCHFSQAVYKRILGREVSVKDMEAHDLAYYGSLKWILDNDITGEDFTFSAEFENFGSTTVVDLIENGRKEIVTNENKKEYVRLMVNHKLVGSVSEQLDALLKGMFPLSFPLYDANMARILRDCAAVACVHIHRAGARAAHLRPAGHRRGRLEEQHRVHGLQRVEPADHVVLARRALVRQGGARQAAAVRDGHEQGASQRL